MKAPNIEVFFKHVQKNISPILLENKNTFSVKCYFFSFFVISHKYSIISQLKIKSLNIF
jgi:hypothetical protein